MINVKRITNLELFAETIPKPKGAVPEFGLPGWKMMPLEHKIPMIPGPKNVYSFTRRKIGRKLWTMERPRLPFDLSDPYCHETRFSYEPLHDEHLLEFFSKPINLKCLLKADLITDGMDVKCSLRDYNAYRKYLRKVHADRIKREMRREDRLFDERRDLRFAEEQARKEVERLKGREKFVNCRQRRMQQRLLKEELKMQKQKKRAQRLKLLKCIKQEERRLINIKREKRAEQIRQKCKIATEIVRRKMIDVVIDWKKKDKARQKAKEKRLMDVEQQKQKDVEERWRRKQEFQEKDIAKQKILLQRIEARRKKFIEEYNTKIDKETAKMQKLLDNAKLFTSCYIKRRLPDGRELICCKKCLKAFSSIKDGEESEIKSNLQNSINFSSKFMKQKKHMMDISNDKYQNKTQKSKHITQEVTIRK